MLVESKGHISQCVFLLAMRIMRSMYETLIQLNGEKKNSFRYNLMSEHEKKIH